MLSQGAFNALLKTLEEPPEHVIFILATTEPQRVPVTIRSRCQHIPFHTISPEDIFKRVEEVCRLEDVKAEPEALWEIARQADGALRDALSLLEQIMASGEITLSNVEASFGAGSRPVFERWIKTLRTDPGEAYTSLKSMFDSGASGVRVFEEMFAIVRDLWLSSKWPKLAGTLGNSEQEKNFLTDEAKNWKPEKLHYLLHTVNKILTQARLGIKSDIILGMFFMSLEPAPRQEESYSPPPALPHPPTRGPEVQKVEAAKSEMKANAVEFDETFKENLLSKAHDEDFTSYCGLYDARPYERDGNLILDMEHIYCYEVLRMSKNSAALSKIFEDYKAVILKFGTAECTCASYEVAQPQPQKTAPEVDEQIAPRDDEEEAQDTRNTPSAFDKFKRELTQLQTKPEIIFIKHSEQDESIDETDYEEEGDDD